MTVPDRLPMPPLDVPVPPMLEAAFGWFGEARYVAFYWTPFGDELCFDTQMGSGTLLGWHSWLAYTHAPGVREHLIGASFGSSEEEADHWLVLDRERREIGALPVTPVDIARTFLRRQWPDVAPEPLQITIEDLEQAAIALQELNRISAAQIAERQQAAAVELAVWLRQYG